LEATQFACNIINVGENILMGAVETDLAARLDSYGYSVAEMPLSEFQRGGGSAKSLALRLSDMSVTHGTVFRGLRRNRNGLTPLRCRLFLSLWCRGVFCWGFYEKWCAERGAFCGEVVVNCVVNVVRKTHVFQCQKIGHPVELFFQSWRRMG
jgi:hypothetical protein